MRADTSVALAVASFRPDQGQVAAKEALQQLRALLHVGLTWGHAADPWLGGGATR